MKKQLTKAEADQVLATLKMRFEKNAKRHPNVTWDEVHVRLHAAADKLWSLCEMERTGGEPDVIGHDKETGRLLFVDCSAESPTGRRSLCYDLEGRESRKEHRPENNAVDVAAAMGIDLLSEDQYRQLQQLGRFDAKTSSWLKTPAPIREKGGAIFGDLRYGHVFIYHNGAQSYYAARGFRGCLAV